MNEYTMKTRVRDNKVKKLSDELDGLEEHYNQIFGYLEQTKLRKVESERTSIKYKQDLTRKGDSCQMDLKMETKDKDFKQNRT